MKPACLHSETLFQSKQENIWGKGAIKTYILFTKLLQQRARKEREGRNMNNLVVITVFGESLNTHQLLPLAHGGSNRNPEQNCRTEFREKGCNTDVNISACFL